MVEQIDPFKLAAAIRDKPDSEHDDSFDSDPEAKRDDRLQAGRDRYDARRQQELDKLAPERRCPLCKRRRPRSTQFVIFDVPDSAPAWLAAIAQATDEGDRRAAVCRTCNLTTKVRDACGKPRRKTSSR